MASAGIINNAPKVEKKNKKKICTIFYYILLYCVSNIVHATDG